MKKTFMTTVAVSFVLANLATAGTLQTRNVIGFDSDMDPIYGTVASDVQTLKVIGYDSDMDPIYGGPNRSVKTQKVIGFDGDMDPIYEQ